MKTCFVGAGSIGRRHIKNLSLLCDRNEIDLQINCLRHDKKGNLPTDVERYIHAQYGADDDLPEDYDIIFVTNPTSMHYETLEKYKNHAKAFFIEKPVFSMDCAHKENPVIGKPAYVAAPLRFSSNMEWLKNNLDVNSVIGVRCICSSYLPEWRPGIDYRTCYSAQKALGGGVKADLIHEWDYLQYLFGFPDTVKMISARKSDLNIDAEDIAVYIAEYPQMTMELHLDYYGRVPRREMEIFTNDDVIFSDITTHTIRFLNSGREISLHQDRDSMYIAELEYVLDVFKGKKENTNTIERACRTLRLTEGIL